ncbi:hypothetical protein LTR49_025822 [Elasticomyces elasticus]|nr:hypothetical protein LTR49_025822 [Elasticomyces elasticus]
MHSSGAAGYGWELNTESCEFITVDSQGTVTMPINDCRDGRTLLPQFQEQHQITYILSDAEDDGDELDVAVDALTLDESANPPKIDRKWLQEHGGSISQANHYGRTPLMEAALWGRLKTVLYLTEQEVDLGTHDGNGMRAADLAADMARIRKERKQRSGMVYREPPDADGQREQIKALWNRPQRLNSEHSQAVSATPRGAFFDRKPAGELEIYRPQVLLRYQMDHTGLNYKRRSLR